MEKEKVIQIENMTKTYGKHRGVIDLSLAVEKGDFFGFLGPNGAGKSTTIRSLLGLIAFQQGTASILGYDVKKENKKILRHIGYMPSEAMFYPEMKVSEVIKFAARSRGMDCSAEAEKLCERLQVDRNKRIEELSLGNRKKVSIVCAMQHKPELFIFDEPTSGLDPLMQAEFFKLIQEYREQGAACFFSSHILAEVKKYCNKAAIIKEGKLVTVDTVENLTKTNAKRVKIEGITSLNLPNMSAVKTNADSMEFIYRGNLEELVKELNAVTFSDLTIEEPDLEEIFMHYYEEANS